MLQSDWIPRHGSGCLRLVPREPVLLFLFRRCSQPDPKDEDLTLEQRDQREVEGTPPAPGVSFLSVDHWIWTRATAGECPARSVRSYVTIAEHRAEGQGCHWWRSMPAPITASTPGGGAARFHSVVSTSTRRIAPSASVAMSWVRPRSTDRTVTSVANWHKPLQRNASAGPRRSPEPP